MPTLFRSRHAASAGPRPVARPKPPWGEMPCWCINAGLSHCDETVRRDGENAKNTTCNARVQFGQLITSGAVAESVFILDRNQHCQHAFPSGSPVSATSFSRGSRCGAATPTRHIKEGVNEDMRGSYMYSQASPRGNAGGQTPGSRGRASCDPLIL